MRCMAESTSQGLIMNFNTIWDVEKYYSRHEPTEHWELRKRFIEVNKTKYPEQKLVSLAATFLNIETMGCSYNPKLMQLIEELSKGVVEGYRERKKQKVQKIFVKASDAAASKVKGQAKTTVKCEKNVPDTDISSDISIIEIISEERVPETVYVADDSVIELSDDSPEPEEEFHVEQGSFKRKQPQWNVIGGKEKKKKKRGGGPHKILSSEDLVPREIPIECCTSYGNMVLIEDDEVNLVPKQILERSASLCRVKLTILEEQPEGSNETTVRIRIRSTELASATDISKKKAREMAYQQALQKLQEECFTIKIKCRRYDQRVGKNFAETEVVMKPVQEKPPSIPNSGSKALKMMANMGWKGGGLGKSQQGITEPISVSVKVNRSGLGIKPKEEKQGYLNINIPNYNVPNAPFQARALAYLDAYARSNNEQDLVFKSEFTSDERKVLHHLASRFDLKSKSYGKQKNRHLVISRKLEPFRIMQTLLTPGFSSQKYELLGPRNSHKY